MKATIKIILLGICFSCTKPKLPPHTYVFDYVDKKTSDTSYFYVFRDLDLALTSAKRHKKNILLIFSGWACSSNRDMEWKTLSLYSDQNKIRENFIIVWLPVDDKRPLIDTSQVVMWYGKERRITDVGDRYKYFEETVFGQSSQPLFCFMDYNKKPFGKVMGYTSTKKEVEEFIDSGLEN